MSKSSEAHLDGASGQSESGGAAEEVRKSRRWDGEVADDAATRRARSGDGGGIDEAEHLQQNLARVRAKGATDPALATRSLSGAWTTHVLEEDEAEFVDAVADCLGAGLSLESALTGWEMGTLAAEGFEDGNLLDEDGERDDETPLAAAALERRHAPAGRRLFVT